MTVIPSEARNLLPAAALGRAVRRSPQRRSVPCFTAQDRDTEQVISFQTLCPACAKASAGGLGVSAFDRRRSHIRKVPEIGFVLSDFGTLPCVFNNLLASFSKKTYVGCPDLEYLQSSIFNLQSLILKSRIRNSPGVARRSWVSESGNPCATPTPVLGDGTLARTAGRGRS